MSVLEVNVILEGSLVRGEEELALSLEALCESLRRRSEERGKMSQELSLGGWLGF